MQRSFGRARGKYSPDANRSRHNHHLRIKNAMRALAVGRKNWLHIGSQEAGPKIAAILSVMETCKRLQINLRKYLNDVLPN